MVMWPLWIAGGASVAAALLGVLVLVLWLQVLWLRNDLDALAAETKEALTKVIAALPVHRP